MQRAEGVYEINLAKWIGVYATKIWEAVGDKYIYLEEITLLRDPGKHSTIKC